MAYSFDEIRQMALCLPEDQRVQLAESLWASASPEGETEVEALWRKEVGEPEPGYDEWFRAGVEEALADTSGDIPHEEAMKEFHEAILRARRLKATA